MKTFLIHFQVPAGNVQFSKYFHAKNKAEALELAKNDPEFQDHILIAKFVGYYKNDL